METTTKTRSRAALTTAALTLVAAVALAGCVPAAPTAPTATAGSGVATVTWTPPADGGAAITSYLITTYTSGQFVGTTTQAAPATSMTVTGLVSGLTYTFTVAAVNAEGTGQPSPPSLPVVPTGSAWLNPNDLTSVTAAWRVLTLASPETGFTGSVTGCTPGTTSGPYRQAELDVVNAFRTLAGVPLAAESAAYTTDAQAAALMMAAEGATSHAPPPTWACYSESGATGASQANLYLGVTGTNAIRGYVQDPGANNSRVGHRRWILCPGTRQMGFGDAGNANATKVMPTTHPYTEASTRDGWVAWPNRGLVPVNLAYGLLARMSVTLPTGWGVTNAVVSVAASAGGTVTPTEVVRDTSNRCSWAVVWVPSRVPAAGETWTTTISGLTDTTGAARTISWSTTYTTITL